jgi:hypothetical protein
MKKSSLILSVLVLIVIIGTADARRGCCSHHGGVCGCACCDGTPLSAVCADPNCYETKTETAPVASEEVSTDSIQTEKNQKTELQNENQEIVSFNTNSGKYHCPSCQWAIKCTRNCISVTREKAIKVGGVPCKVCGGRCY